jgi:hypothetical protein
MKLYHGSTQRIEQPDLSKGRKYTDFGKGFYTTTNMEQAAKWATIKRGRILRYEPEKKVKAIVSVFEINDTLLKDKKYNTKIFDKPTIEWLEFVIHNRNHDAENSFDMILGPVANDTVYATLDLYEQGTLTAEATIDRLKTHKIFDQLSFHTETSLKEIRFVEAIEV